VTKDTQVIKDMDICTDRHKYKQIPIIITAKANQ